MTTTSERTSKLSLMEKIGFGLGDAGFNFYWVIIGSWLMYFYTDVFKVSAAFAGTMFAVTKIIDACTDPVIGAWSDRTQTRWGKFRPFILFGALPLMAAGVLALSTPDFSEGGKAVWVTGTYILLMLCYTIVNIPYNSLSGVMTADANERSSLFSIRFFFAYAAGIFVGTVTQDFAIFLGDGDEAKGWQLTMAVYGLIATLLFTVTFFTTRERIAPPPQQQTNALEDIKDLIGNRPWIILLILAFIIMITIVLRGSSAPYYFKYFVQRPDLMGVFIGLQMAAYAIGALCSGFLTRRFEKVKLLMTLMTAVAVFSFAFTFVPKPESNGVVTVSAKAGATLNAVDLSGVEHSDENAYEWYSHEQTFWIFREKVAIGDNSPAVTIDPTDDKKQKDHVISVVVTPAGQATVDSSVLPKEIWIMFLLNILISLALGPKSPLTWSMYADAADYNEWRTGRRATGMTFSGATFFQKIGGALGSAVIGWVLASIGYVAGVAQSGASQFGIVLLQTALPAVFALIAVFALKFYYLDKKKMGKIQADLNARKQDVAPA